MAPNTGVHELMPVHAAPCRSPACFLGALFCKIRSDTLTVSLQVSKVEFMMFILEHLELVDRSELDRILAMFNAADLIGDGVLTTADVHAHCARLAGGAPPTPPAATRASRDTLTSAPEQLRRPEHSAAGALSKPRESASGYEAAGDAELVHEVQSGLQDLEGGQAEPLLATSQVWGSGSSGWEPSSRGRSSEKRLGDGET